MPSGSPWFGGRSPPVCTKPSLGPGLAAVHDDDVKPSIAVVRSRVPRRGRLRHRRLAISGGKAAGGDLDRARPRNGPPTPDHGPHLRLRDSTARVGRNGPASASAAEPEFPTCLEEGSATRCPPEAPQGSRPSYSAQLGTSHKLETRGAECDQSLGRLSDPSRRLRGSRGGSERLSQSPSAARPFGAGSPWRSHLCFTALVSLSPQSLPFRASVARLPLWTYHVGHYPVRRLQ